MAQVPFTAWYDVTASKWKAEWVFSPGVFEVHASGATLKELWIDCEDKVANSPIVAPGSGFTITFANKP